MPSAPQSEAVIGAAGRRKSEVVPISESAGARPGPAVRTAGIVPEAAETTPTTTGKAATASATALPDRALDPHRPLAAEPGGDTANLASAEAAGEAKKPPIAALSGVIATEGEAVAVGTSPREAEAGTRAADTSTGSTRQGPDAPHPYSDARGRIIDGDNDGGDDDDDDDKANQSLDSCGTTGSSSSEDRGPPTPSAIGENPYRPGSRSSMYPELFQEMVCTVLESESYLFSNAEVDLLSAFFMLSYAARYLFVRLLQRKRDAWYRLDRLTAYEQEIGDLRPAKDELARSLRPPAKTGPKIEHARREEESRRLQAIQRGATGGLGAGGRDGDVGDIGDEDKENLVQALTLPELQRNLHLDESTGLSQPGAKRTSLAAADSNARRTASAAAGHTAQDRKAEGGDDGHALSRFVLTEADMHGGAEESMSLLTLDELKVLAKKLNIAKTGTTRAQHIAALLATKSQSTLFSAPSPSKKGTAVAANSAGGGRQLTLNFGSSGKKAAQANRLREELAEVLRGGCIQVVPEVRSLVDRVALVYYRGNLLGSAALTAAILSRSRRRNYPIYGFRRSGFLFPSRDHLIAFERALEIEARMEHLIQFGKSERDHREALELFESVYPEWQACVDECVRAHPDGVDKLVYHRMRFHPGWVLSRVVYKGAACLARFKLHDRERDVLTRLLDQRVFRRGRRGDWYDRLALITALYSDDARRGKKEALRISIRGIQDPDTHLIYHDTLQRRIGRLESQLRVPRSEQHDFSYAKLKRTTEVVFEGVRLDVMLDQDDPGRDGGGDSPGARMSSFLGRQPARSSSPSPSSAKTMRRSASERSLGGSPLKRQQSDEKSPSPSGFQVRKPLFKRVKVETFAPTAKQEPAPEVLPPIKDEAGQGGRAAPGEGDVGAGYSAPSSSPSSPSANDHVAGASAAATTPTRPTAAVKREESSDSLTDDLALDGIDAPALLQEDPTLFSLGLNSAAELTPVETRKETRSSMRSVWRGLDGRPCHVEQLCLQHYAQQGFRGSHCEGKVLTMIFALVMWDVLFRSDVEGAFETPFQAAPLDLGSDAFAVVRSREIRERLDEIERTGGLHLIARADDEQRPRRTWAVGCRWDLFGREELLEVAQCLGGRAIAVVCQMFCEEWEHCTGGMPDLVIWRMRDRCVRFVEVKGPGDRLSETQKVWIDVLLRAGVDVQVGLVVEAAGDGGGAAAARGGQ
ncbi:uncharacterized protein PFL1_06512 [Pseudozyma flocculosa PF-1]|uniref:Fanconi-associated nuclease n=1 Tax=Pseudozyma flocculosa PF-1 TaxID=1277687 RepID=A0A061H0L2_9BASI|nr:uncharacterized protein PFL1_06512 [Pseudozyma flocculosa PF-1]EPQ25837.1 hypothetical protein PFL1_06512 [Pseudozyma flocculosa PF-1]